jgi:hypothetical protein
MSANTLQLYSQQPNGVTYADPTDPDFVVRFKTTSAQKVLDGQRAQNFITEITANDSHVVTVAGKEVTDMLSVRIRTSGSLQSMDRIKQMLADLCAKVDDWTDESVLIGFKPTTPPINTVDPVSGP